MYFIINNINLRIMKKLFFSILALSMFLPVILAQKTGIPSKSLALDTVISEINKSLVLAQNKLENFEILSAEISLQTSKEIKGGGKAKFFVKAGHTWESGNTVTMVYIFSPPNQQEFIKANDRVKPLSEKLAEAITEAAIEFNSSQNKIPGLAKEKFKISLNFTITDNSEGGIEFEVFGIGIDTGVSYNKERSHNVTLEFGKKSQP